MQTREPGKRVNWIFVVVLIITIPIVIFTIIMINTMPTHPTNTGTYDSTQVGVSVPDSLIPDTSTNARQDSILRNNK